MTAARKRSSTEEIKVKVASAAHSDLIVANVSLTATEEKAEIENRMATVVKAAKDATIALIEEATDAETAKAASADHLTQTDVTTTGEANAALLATTVVKEEKEDSILTGRTEQSVVDLMKTEKQLQEEKKAKSVVEYL